MKIRRSCKLRRAKGETEQENLLKDPDMFKRLNEIEKRKPEEKSHVLFALDAMIQKLKLKVIAALDTKTRQAYS